LGEPPTEHDAIEPALANRDVSVRGIYNIGAYWEERVRMAQWWADYLDNLRKGAEIVRSRVEREVSVSGSSRWL
jgi:hypothetical protein